MVARTMATSSDHVGSICISRCYGVTRQMDIVVGLFLNMIDVVRFRFCRCGLNMANAGPRGTHALIHAWFWTQQSRTITRQQGDMAGPVSRGCLGEVSANLKVPCSWREEAAPTTLQA